jgi:hypothetical protein
MAMLNNKRVTSGNHVLPQVAPPGTAASNAAATCAAAAAAAAGLGTAEVEQHALLAVTWRWPVCWGQFVA